MVFRTLSVLLFSGLALAASYPVLTYSTYLRDSFTPMAIATDSSGNIYMAGNAIIDPTSPPCAKKMSHVLRYAKIRLNAFSSSQMLKWLRRTSGGA